MERVTPVMMGAVAAALAVIAQAFLWVVPPPAYGLCIVCHGRDLVVWLTGTLSGLPVQVAEASMAWPLLTVVGVFLGARYAAVEHDEYRRQWVEPRVTAFLCGMGVMILGLLIMGCPTRLLLRAAYGDPIGAAGAVSVLLGVAAATFVMRRRAR